ncbi:MAG: hypothetical protein JWP63_2536 [Candidatus Solibacter sp.]|nr:hypothetical protein [Candidatus Solibacter sp.]
MNTQTEELAIKDLIHGMARAWNAGSGAAFAACCEEHADFVNIYGTHARGRQAIAEGHDHIFRTVYAGSTLHYSIVQMRFLNDDIAVVHLRAHLEIPQGPMAGEKNSVPSMVLRRTGAEWRVASFQNTLVGNPGTQN